MQRYKEKDAIEERQNKTTEVVHNKWTKSDNNKVFHHQENLENS